jgi:hypothetical protein
MGWVVGVDVGGTFTDFHAVDATGTVRRHKRPSTPDNPAAAIINGLKELCAEHDIPIGTIERLGHGTTVATNALIQRRGGTVALITTKGFRDLLEIGRQTRPRMYDLQADHPPPLVPRERRFEVEERVKAGGRSTRPLLGGGGPARAAAAPRRSRCACSSPSSIPSTSAASARHSPRTSSSPSPPTCSPSSASTSVSRPPCSTPISSR